MTSLIVVVLLQTRECVTIIEQKATTVGINVVEKLYRSTDCHFTGSRFEPLHIHSTILLSLPRSVMNNIIHQCAYNWLTDTNMGTSGLKDRSLVR